MRSFKLEEIDGAVLDEFNAHHPQGNFQQSTRMAEVRRAEGAEVSYLGVLEDGRLVAASQLEVHHSGISTFAQVHDGPLCDFHDTELTAFFLGELGKRARQAGAAQLDISPEVPYQIRDTNGKALPADGTLPLGVPTGSVAGADEAAFQTIVGCGFEHAGFDHTYNAVPRWRYVKDLIGIADQKALVATYVKNTKRNVRIAQSSGVVVEKVGRDGLAEFHHLCELSCEKQGFENRPLSYFELLYDKLGDSAEFNVAYIDSLAFLKEWEDKRDEYKAEMDHFQKALATAQKPEKVQKKLDDMTSKYQAALKRIEVAHSYIESDGEHIPAAAAMFVWHPRECVYLFSGSDPKYAKFYAATAIQHHVIMECMERGVPSYNFYGINGVFDDPQDPGRGLLEFKQGFGGYVEEMMGSFTLPVRPVVFAAKRLAHKVLGR